MKDTMLNLVMMSMAYFSSKQGTWMMKEKLLLYLF